LGRGYDWSPSLAAELAGRDLARLLPRTSQHPLRQRRRPHPIPIIFAIGPDPVKLAVSNNPAASHTDNHAAELFATQAVVALDELSPGFSAVAWLVNLNNLSSQIDTPQIQAASDALGRAATDSELDAAFTTMVRQRVDALVVKPDPFRHLPARTVGCTSSAPSIRSRRSLRSVV